MIAALPMTRSFADVERLALGEPDYFERKSGQWIEDGGFRQSICKTVSAFANSGGGTLIVGVENDGTPAGVPCVHKGRPTREWLEQLIPSLTEPPITLFRVHDVLDCPLLAQSGKLIVVIDIADQLTAPHQSSFDQIYYYRSGGHSRPAKHFYIELLRKRNIGPALQMKSEGIQLFAVRKTLAGTLLQFRVRLKVTNTGRATATRWNVQLLPIAMDGANTKVNILTENFPSDALIPMRTLLSDLPDSSIFPGHSRTAQKFVSALLPDCDNADALSSCLLERLSDREFIEAVVFSEAGPSEPMGIALDESSRGVLAARIPQLLPHPVPPDEYALGYGITVSNSRISASQSSDDLRFRCTIRNRSMNRFREIELSLRARDQQTQRILTEETLRLRGLPPHGLLEVDERLSFFNSWFSPDLLSVVVTDIEGVSETDAKFQSIFSY